MEDCLIERFDSVLAAVQRTKPGDSLVGRKSQSATLNKVLEEVSVVYSCTNLLSMRKVLSKSLVTAWWW